MQVCRVNFSLHGVIHLFNIVGLIQLFWDMNSACLELSSGLELSSNPGTQAPALLSLMMVPFTLKPFGNVI